jgi:hypothetical protein
MPEGKAEHSCSPPSRREPPAGSMVFTRAPMDVRHINLWWTWTPGASRRHRTGPRSGLDGLDDHPVVHSRRGRRVVCVAGGAGAAHGGGVGSRRARRSRARPYVWGMTSSQRGSGWPTTGTVTSRGEPSQVTGIPKGRFVPRQRLRPLRHGWQRLGVDGRLVCVASRRGAGSCTVLHPRNPHGVVFADSYCQR